MAVIREDVVSIGFEVENNPLSELAAEINDIKAKLGILSDTSAGLKEVSKEAITAGQGLDGLANSVHAPPGLNESVKEAQNLGDEAQKAVGALTGLENQMKDTGGVRLTDGVEDLAKGIKKPEKGLKALVKDAKGLGDSIKKVGLPYAFGVGIGKALIGSGKLLVKLKEVAGLGFNKAISGLKNLASEAGKAAGAIGKGTLNATGKLAKGVGVGIAAAGTALAVGAVAAFNFGSAYETSLAKVSTMVDTSVMSVQELSSEVMSLSNDTGEGAAGLNEAVYQALSAGADTAGVVDLVGTAVKAARGGFTDTTTAIDGLTSTLNAYGMETKDAEGLANSFLITQNKGKTTFGELASSIGSVAPTASAAGVGVNELLAGVASLTANGIGTSEAMTGIKAAMSNVIKPSAEAAKVAQSLGLDFSTAALQSKGLAGFLDDVKTATGGNMDTMAQLFGSVEALNTVLTLTSDNGMELMQDTMNEMATNTTALDTAYETMSDTAQVSVQKGLNSFKNLGIGIYQANEGPVAELTGLFANSGQELYKAFETGGMDGLSVQIGATLSNALITLTAYLPKLIQGGVSIVQSLISGIVQNRGQITQSIMSGLTTMLMGILQIAPQLITAGILLISSLLQGLDQQMPSILTAGLSAIQNLCAGLLANGPTIIQSGISIIMQLINGLVAAAPVILTAGVQLIVMLVQGLASALPGLIGAAGQLAGEIIRALLSINWLKLGLDIIVGIGSGLVQGIKGLFSKGKDAGKEVGDGVTAGLDESTSQLTAATDVSTAAAAEGFKPDTDLLSSYGMQMPTAVASGMESGAAVLDASATSMGSAASDSMNLAMENMLTGSQPAFTDLSSSFDQTLTGMDASAVTQMGQMDMSMQAGFQGMVSDASVFKGDLKGEIDQIDLYDSGTNAMQGLNDGLSSMRGTVMATAQSIASDVKNTINSTLDIHSPSRVMEESGEYTGLGLVKGMENLTGRIVKTAQGIADKTAFVMSPVRSRYSPESSGTTNSQNSSQVNQYSPVFNLTLNGASASDSNERKVKRWVKDAMNEAVQSMGRTNLRTREV